MAKERCAGCAFTPGTEASQWPLITLQAQCAVEAVHPFFCHETVHPRTGEPLELCAGFVEAMDERHRKGLYENLTEERRTALLECIRHAQLAEHAIGTEDRGAGRRIARLLRRTLRRKSTPSTESDHA